MLTLDLLSTITPLLMKPLFLKDHLQKASSALTSYESLPRLVQDSVVEAGYY